MTVEQLRELASSYQTALGEFSTVIVSAAVVLTAVSLPMALRRPKRVPAWISAALAVPVVVGGVLWAARLAWISDDAFISFRYARNLVHGQGLVFNPGERVEGYTNFLWTLLMAAAMKLGAHPVQASVVLGLASLAAALATTTFIARTMIPGSRRMSLSFAALGLACSYGFASFGTSGMETGLAALLVLVALALAHEKRYLASSIAGVLATLTHPDHLLFWVALGAAVISLRPRWYVVRRYAWPLVVLVVWTAWRYWYYGDLLPCTYYAKGVSGEHFAQGAYYIAVSLVASGLLGALPLFIIGAWRGHRLLVVRFVLIATPLYLFYVAKIGGDFMLGRLLVPWMAPYLLVAEVGARYLLGRRWPRRMVAVPAVLPLALAAVPNGVVPPRQVVRHIADERSFYALESFAPPRVSSVMQPVRQVLEQYFIAHGFRPRVGLRCMGLVAYETQLPIFDDSGLTTPSVAHMKLLVRGRPGHEKLATPGHLLEGNVDLGDLRVYPVDYDRFSLIRLANELFFLAKFEPTVIDHLLKQPRVSIYDVRKYIDQLSTKPPVVSDSVSCDLWFLEQFYFRWANDEPRRRRLARALGSTNPDLRAIEDVLLRPVPPNFKEVLRFDFDADALRNWEAEGPAFEGEPRTDDVAGQQATFGNDGPYVSSFHEKLRDAARGRIRSPEFAIDGDVLTFRISGGYDVAELGVSLWVNGQVVRRATACSSEIMGRRAWDVSPWRGQRGRLEIHDTKTGAWGHVAVDEFVLWAAR